VVVKLLLEYDGTGFAGWQVQRGRHRRTVQGELEAALSRLPGNWGPVQGAGRTDAGAHAEGQVASVAYEGPLALRRLRGAINAHLPEDVAVLSVEAVADGFHARYSAVSRHYRYRYLDREVRPVLDRGRCWWVRAPLDEVAMRAALPALTGSHDWTTLCAAAVVEEDRVRRLLSAGVVRRGRFLDLDLVGEGFLRGLVRGIAGALLEVGRGRRDPAWPGQIVGARDRRLAPRVAPSCGLTLVAVHYPPTHREARSGGGESGEWRAGGRGVR
jgi:tRNA pseudouridine38-40 synthase